MNLIFIGVILFFCNNPLIQQGDKLTVISEEMNSPLCEGTEVLIQNPKSFGIVIGDA